MKWYSKYLPVYEKPFAEVPAETVAKVRAKLAERQSDRPLATVSVIACNEEKRLTACLWSLAEQRCRYPMEIIATDNLSKDRTAEIFETPGLPWQRETTPGCGHARLCGLNRARGKYHINIDADTIYPPRYVETMVDALERRAADPAVKLMLLCNPHNPAGRVWTPEELRRIGDICLRRDILVVADEIHCELVMPGFRYTPFASLSEEFARRSVTCASPSKAFNLAGVQVANIFAADAGLRERIARSLEINETGMISPFAIEALTAAYDEGVRSFWLNAFSSPWTPWEKIALKFLQAKDDPQKLKVVYNTLLGELWEDRGDIADEDTMLARREDYGTNADGSPVEVPEGVLVLTCGVDTQDNRLEYEVVGHGFYGETWGIKKGYIMGKPDTDEVWQQLDDVIDHVYRFNDGKGLRISITCVDSGGHYTQEVYTRCRERKNKRVFAIKGKGGDGIPFVTPPSKVPIKDNKRITCWLYTLGVDAGKETIMSSLKVQEAGPKYCHFPIHESCGYDTYYFNGLLSERLELTQTKRGNQWHWVKIPGHNRNEALDCRNYANAGLKIIDPDMFAVERRLKNVQETPQTKPAQRRKPKPAARNYFDEW